MPAPFNTPAKAPIITPEMRHKARQEALRLIRLRISCMNLAKNDLDGEIITVANGVIGTVRKFIPFGEAAEVGYHVPYCIYEQLKQAQYVQLKVKRSKSGEARRNETPEARLMPEYALEVLPPLNKSELQELAKAQQSRPQGDDE